jgi:hypothetical protein
MDNLFFYSTNFLLLMSSLSLMSITFHFTNFLNACERGSLLCQFLYWIVHKSMCLIVFSLTSPSVQAKYIEEDFILKRLLYWGWVCSDVHNLRNALWPFWILGDLSTSHQVFRAWLEMCSKIPHCIITRELTLPAGPKRLKCWPRIAKLAQCHHPYLLFSGVPSYHGHGSCWKMVKSTA